MYRRLSVFVNPFHARNALEFRLFVLPKSRSGRLFSNIWRTERSIVFGANRHASVSFRPSGICPVALSYASGGSGHSDSIIMSFSGFYRFLIWCRKSNISRTCLERKGFKETARHRYSGQQPGMKSGRRPAYKPNEPLVNRGLCSSIPEHILHEKGLQRQLGVGTLVSNQERRAAVVRRTNRG